MLAKFLQILIAVLIVFGCRVVAKRLIATKPEAEKIEREKVIPVVEVAVARKASYPITLRTQGEVESTQKTLISAEVGGSIVEVSPRFELGGQFKKGEVIVEIDSVDYQTALVRAETILVQAEANVSKAEVELEMERSRSEQAKRDWKKLGRGREASDLLLRKPQLKNAKASVTSAQASVRQAQADIDQALRQLERTKIKAPYDCQVLKKQASLGALAIPGQPLVEIEQVGRSQVRFPVALEDVGLMPSAGSAEEVQVKASAVYSGQKQSWTGVLKRKEDRIDTASRSFYYTAEFTGESVPPVGLFVKLELQGSELSEVYRLPRVALRAESNVLVVKSDNALAFVKVEVIRSDEDYIYIGSGLEAEDRVCITVMDTAIAGMEVSVKSENPEPSDK